MVQDLSRIGIIGGGASGVACAYFLTQSNPSLEISIIDYGEPLRTILVTGGGRCNLCNYEFDFKELAKNYPRGEKFLYSIFSRFSTSDTIEFFDGIGVETYVQEDMRVFPKSNSAKVVREKMLDSVRGVKFIKEKALRIEKLENRFKVVTDMNSYYFDKLVYSTGGHNGYDMIKRLGVSVVESKPSLVSLVTEKGFPFQMGVVLKDVYNRETGISGDLLFTHFGISGPLVYKISAIKAYDKFPYELTFDLCNKEIDFQELLNSNPHKRIKNLLLELFPQKIVQLILSNSEVDEELKCHKIDGKMRDRIISSFSEFRVIVKGTKKDGETVTAGGVDLNQINPKTMESKQVEGLYFCGEVVDIDGFCGGFNLQNCWSTAYVVSEGILS